MFASGSHDSVIKLEAAFASNNDKLGPPVTLSNTPFAPLIDVSRSGDCIASLAASIALFSPTPKPIPISAEPRFAITVLTSAKSRLTKPDTAIKSLID